jgi:hypothetical protein
MSAVLLNPWVLSQLNLRQVQLMRSRVKPSSTPKRLKSLQARSYQKTQTMLLRFWNNKREMTPKMRLRWLHWNLRKTRL